MRHPKLAFTLFAFFSLLSLPSLAQEKKEYFLNVNVVPLGPVPLAKFTTSKKSASKVKEDSEDTAKEKEGGKSSAPTQGGQIIVVETPKDERPPEAIYYKLGSDYIRLSCNLNAVGKPTRLPVKAKVLKFYTRGENNADGKPTYKFLFDHEWSPEQESMLFTLTKPLKTLKWKNPEVKKYDTSPSNLRNSKFLLINASQNSTVKIATKEGSKNIAPHGASLHTGDKVVALTLAAVEGNTTLPPYKRYFPVKNGQLSLLIVYPVTPAEDYHRIKFVQSRITEGSYKKAVIVR